MTVPTGTRAFLAYVALSTLFLSLVVSCKDEKRVFRSGDSSASAATANQGNRGASATSRPTSSSGRIETHGSNESAEVAPPSMADGLRPNAPPVTSRPTGGQPSSRPTGPQPSASDFSGIDIPLRFGTPKGWISEKPENNMRVRQYKLPAAEGESEPGSVVIYLFPGAGGTPEKNIARWMSQMKSNDGEAIGKRAVRDQFVVNGYPVWSVDMTGRYATQSMVDGSQIDKPDMRFVGFVIVAGEENFFVKCLGGKATIEKWRRSIQTFVNDACAPSRFQTRPGFVAEAPRSRMRKAQFRLPKAEGAKTDAELVVFFFPGGAGSVEQNIARWTSQFKQPDGQPTKDVVATKTETVGSSTITFLDVTGTYDTMDMVTREAVNEPNYRMIAAIIVDGSSSDSHFVRALGPAATVERWAEDVRAFVRAAALP